MPYRAAALVFAWVMAACSAGSVGDPPIAPSAATSTPAPAAVRAEGLRAWDQVYSVLMHPRCLNCHTADAHPQQGDDRHRHLFHVVRGADGHGVPGLRCGTCHQEANNDAAGVPGERGWHLAPLSMAWQTADRKPLSSADVCRAVTDRSRNENMDGPALLKHHQDAPLVLWAWRPGRSLDGAKRAVPPLTHEELVAATRTWVEAGTPCP